MACINIEIMNKGGIQSATKLPVVTIGIGKVADLKDLDGVIWHDEQGRVVIATKEHPEGDVYEQDREVVVRVIGGKVLMNGKYDIYAPAPHKIGKLLGNVVDIDDQLTPEQQDELWPLIEVASAIIPSLAPAEYGRKVVLITEEMVGGAGYIECVCTWHEDSGELTKLFPGDVFLVEDEALGHGYRIGAEEFNETHVID